MSNKGFNKRQTFNSIAKKLANTGIQVFNAIDAESFPMEDEGERVYDQPACANEWSERAEYLNPLTYTSLLDTVATVGYMASYLQLQPVHCALFMIIMSLQLKDGKPVNFWDIRQFLAADIIDIHPLQKEMEWLEKNGYIRYVCSMRFDGYLCLESIVDSIINNKDFEKPAPMVLDRYKFCELVDQIVRRGERIASPSRDLIAKMTALEEKYKELKMVETVTSILYDDIDRMLFYKLCKATACDCMLAISLEDTIIDIITDGSQRYRYVNNLLKGYNPLLENGLVELKPSGLTSDTMISLSAKGKEIIFEDDVRAAKKRESTVSDIIRATEISDVKLFFEGELSRNICELRSALEEKNFVRLQSRLAENSLPKGVTAVFYGAPGTGKTELARQIARETGRTIMQVDISRIKSCWVGESEKRIKEVFAEYSALCADENMRPILLFNEADAILTSRQDPSASNNSSVVQMMNAMQNIILEEMERLDGILIATTNLHTNLDPAFERRFLYKIRFEKPDRSVRKSIWKSKMPRLTDEEAEALSLRHNFSGGEIDNIVRKTLINEILSGEKSCLDRIESYCKSERFSKDGVAKIGFQTA